MKKENAEKKEGTPRTSDTRPVIFNLPNKQIEKLKKVAKKNNLSYSKCLSLLVDFALNNSEISLQVKDIRKR